MTHLECAEHLTVLAEQHITLALLRRSVAHMFAGLAQEPLCPQTQELLKALSSWLTLAFSLEESEEITQSLFALLGSIARLALVGDLEVMLDLHVDFQRWTND
jgi:hypothetical protein